MQIPAGTDARDEVSTALLAELRSRISPDRVLTDGPEYARAVALFNAAVDVRPSVVVRCATTADVQAGVRASRNHGVPLSVRGGGHDFWGRAFRPGGLVLDLTDMREVRIDVDNRCATVGGGALSSDVVSAAERAGLTAVTGTAGSVGMVGLTLGGGYGPLLGQFGLAADNLLGAEVVLADGSRVNTDAEHDPDLFWALRGGGNFGVVTSARIRLHPVSTVVSGTILYPIAQSAGILADLGGILQDSPDELTVDVGFLPGPDGKPTVYVAPTWSGDLEVGNAENGPVRALAGLGTHVLAEVGPVARSVTLAATDAMFPPGRMGAIRTRTVQSVSSSVATVLDRAAQEFTSPFSAIVWYQFHGAATRPPLGSTAFGRREPHLMVELISMWESGESNDHAGRAVGSSPHLRWLEELHAALEPFSLPGGYVNFLGPETPDQVVNSYGANAQRLLALKSAFDPDSVFAATPLPLGKADTDSTPV